jgi:hypothetical protein
MDASFLSLDELGEIPILARVSPEPADWPLAIVGQLAWPESHQIPEGELAYALKVTDRDLGPSIRPGDHVVFVAAEAPVTCQWVVTAEAGGNHVRRWEMGAQADVVIVGRVVGKVIGVVPSR